MARSVKTRLAWTAPRPKDSNRTRASHCEGAGRFAEGAGISSDIRRHAARPSGASGPTATARPPRRRWLLCPRPHGRLPQQPCSRRSQRLLLYDSIIEVMRPPIFIDMDTPRVQRQLLLPAYCLTRECYRKDGRHPVSGKCNWASPSDPCPLTLENRLHVRPVRIQTRRRTSRWMWEAIARGNRET